MYLTSMDLSLSDILMAHVYIRSYLIYDYHIDDLGESFNEFVRLYCPQALQSLDIFSKENRIEQSIDKYLRNEDFDCEDLFPYDSIPTDTSPLIFLHEISLKDGTILSFGCHHYLSDGHGFSLLGQRFALWLKGKSIPLFDHDRSKLKCLALQSKIDYEHEEMSLMPRQSLSFDLFTPIKTIVKSYRKDFLFEQLKITNENQLISFNDVLVAYLTKLISQIRAHPSQCRIKVGMAINGRPFLPNIDENFFGNCSFYLCHSFSMIDLTNLSVDQLSKQIHDDKQKYLRKEYLQSTLAFIEKHHRTSPIYLGWEPTGGIDLSFTNWSKFPLYKCDFGQGIAKSFGLPSIKADGLILILPTLNSDEIQLRISLQHQHAEQLFKQLI